MKIVNKITGILHISEASEVSDTEIEVAIGKSLSQLKSLVRKTKGVESAVYSYLVAYLFREKRPIIRLGIRKEL